MSDRPEFSPSGSPIYRHQARERDFRLAPGDGEALEAIEKHIETYVGQPANVLHEIVSDLVHIDVHIVQPTPRRNFYTLVTSGMSDLPMSAPPGAEAFRFMELMLCLPPDWPMPGAYGTVSDDERVYWPIRWLKQLARLPHEYQTWLWAMHTVPNGDPPRPFAPNTKLCGMLVSFAVSFDPKFAVLPVRPGKTIHYFSLLPLHQAEMDFKLRKGAEPLLDRLGRAGVTEVVDIARPSVVKKWLF